jgi:nucleolar MIF4G domain-containing protein 1
VEKEEEEEDFIGKNTINLVFLISFLFNFQFFETSLFLELVQEFTQSLDEFHVELLLKLLKHAGYQLRSNDPQALKNIILAIHQKYDTLLTHQKG